MSRVYRKLCCKDCNVMFMVWREVSDDAGRRGGRRRLRCDVCQGAWDRARAHHHAAARDYRAEYQRRMANGTRVNYSKQCKQREDDAEDVEKRKLLKFMLSGGYRAAVLNVDRG